MSRRTKRIVVAVLVILGLGLLLYPFFASKYNARHQSLVAAHYQEEIKKADKADLEHCLEQARQYNAGLMDGRINGLDPSKSGYTEQLVTPDGAMAILRIPSIDAVMPIYHGVDSYSMTIGAGHMPNTSLPIGGESTHCAVSSHSGMASHRGFTDLPDMEIGDFFYVDVLDQTLTYQVTDIQTVLPHEIDCLSVVQGKDLFSLVTCVPIAVNSHRLVVTGSRVTETPASATEPAAASAEQPEFPVAKDSGMDNGLHFALLLIVLIVIILFFILRKKKKSRAGG